MIPSQDAIDKLADRIERAYRRHHAHWRPVGTTPGVWRSAACRLYEASEIDSSVPIDPELFVVAQPRGRLRPDPWTELTQSHSLRRYLNLIRQIVMKLLVELRGEMRRADRKLLRGLSLDNLLGSGGSRISPLGRYILAHRAGRSDLEMRYRSAAEAQHRACPLYRLASQSLLPLHAYPLPMTLRSAVLC